MQTTILVVGRIDTIQEARKAENALQSAREQLQADISQNLLPSLEKRVPTEWIPTFKEENILQRLVEAGHVELYEDCIVGIDRTDREKLIRMIDELTSVMARIAINLKLEDAAIRGGYYIIFTAF